MCRSQPCPVLTEAHRQIVSSLEHQFPRFKTGVIIPPMGPVCEEPTTHHTRIAGHTGQQRRHLVKPSRFTRSSGWVSGEISPVCGLFSARVFLSVVSCVFIFAPNSYFSLFTSQTSLCGCRCHLLDSLRDMLVWGVVSYFPFPEWPLLSCFEPGRWCCPCASTWLARFPSSAPAGTILSHPGVAGLPRLHCDPGSG